MANSPKDNKEKYTRFLESWKNLAPDKKFGGITLAEFTAQVAKSNAPRERLIELDDEKTNEETNLTNADIDTMKMCESIKNGVVGDPEFGDNSALYESFGFIRKSERKTGLTRKKKPAAPTDE